MLVAAKMFFKNCPSNFTYFQCVIDSLSLSFFINHFKIIFFTIKLSKYATQIKKIDTPIFWKILDTNMDFFLHLIKSFKRSFFNKKKNYIASFQIYFLWRRLPQGQTLLSSPWQYGPGFFPIFLSVVWSVLRNQAACRYYITELFSRVTSSILFTTATPMEVSTTTGSSTTEAHDGVFVLWYIYIYFPLFLTEIYS